MKRTYTIQFGHMGDCQIKALGSFKIAAVSVEQALDKAQAKSRAMNRLPNVPAHLKTDYLLCSGFIRVVS